MNCPTCGREDTRVVRTLPSSDLVIRVQRCIDDRCPRFETRERLWKVLPVAGRHAPDAHGHPPASAQSTPANTESVASAHSPVGGLGGNSDLDPISSGPSQQSDPEAISRSDRTRVKAPQYTEDFKAFWTAYPRKTGKGAAWAAWQKTTPVLGTALSALFWQVRSKDWTKDGGAFIPLPATYLNQRRWEDEPQRALPRIQPAPEREQLPAWMNEPRPAPLTVEQRAEIQAGIRQLADQKAVG